MALSLHVYWAKKLKPWNLLEAIYNTGCFMEGLTVKCKRLIRCFLVPFGSYGAYAIHIWSAMRRSNKTEGIMPGTQSVVLLGWFQKTFFK